MQDPFEEGLKRDFPRGLADTAEAAPLAQWAAASQLQGEAWAWTPQSIFLGYRGNRRIGPRDDRHFLTVAGSRAGKGISLIIPNLLLYEGSVMAIDPKGELARITKRHRAEKLGHRCFVLDPFDANRRHPSAAFNPLNEIDPDSLEAIDDAALVADALIVPNLRDPYWTDSAKQMLHGILLYVLTLPEEERTLLTMRQLLIGTHRLIREVPDDFAHASALERLWARLISRDDKFDGLAAAIGERFSRTPDKELGSIVASATSQTAFLDSPALRPVLGRSDFSLADLKERPTTVYLCLPAGRMGTHARWLRVMVSLALQRLERQGMHASHQPVLLLLEEFNVLGHMPAVEIATGQIAGFGVKIWTVLQDLTQLQRHYDKAWETFIGNAGITTAFGNSDVTTLRYVSEKLGTRSIVVQTASGASLSARLQGTRGTQENLRVEPLMSPAEFEQAFARESKRLLVLRPGSPPVVLQRADYSTHPDFAGMFDEP